MRVAFENTAVHKSTGIPFVGVTDHIFHIALGLAREFPFHTRREPGAAAAAKPGFFHLLDHFFRFHRGQDLGKGLITVPRDIVPDL